MTQPTSNTKGRIDELRRRIAANKGIAKRARGTVILLNHKVYQAERQIRWDQEEIESMGGKVKR